MANLLGTLTQAGAGWGNFFHEMGEVARYRELISNLVSRDLKVRYKRSAIGFFWTMLSPLLMMIVTTIVFSNLFKGAITNFAIYFLSAFLLWNFFSQSTVAGMTVMMASASILRRVYIPKSVFVVAAVIPGFINFALALLILLPIMLIMRHPISFNLLWLPIPLIAAIGFTLGVSLLMAAWGVFWADVSPMYQVLLTAWMYLTPIMYPLSIVPPNFIVFIKANPLYYIIETFRAPIYYGVPPDPTFVFYSYVSAAIALVFGWWVFSRGMDRFVYYL